MRVFFTEFYSDLLMIPHMALCNGCVHSEKSDRSRFLRRDRSSLMKKKKERIHQIYHRETYCYLILSHNTSVPIYDFELSVGTLTSHASWAWL